MSVFPPLLRQHLVDESHVLRARQLLEDHLNVQKARAEAIRGSMTSVDFLLAAAGRPRQISQDIKAIELDIQKSHHALNALIRIQTILATEIENLTESYVREANPAYLRGLAALENITDWVRAIDRFENRLHAYRVSLGNARNLVVAGYDRTRRLFSAAGDQALEEAVRAAGNLDQETSFANRIADEHTRIVLATPFQKVLLPHIPVAAFQDWTSRLSGFDIGMMQAEFTRILGMAEVLEDSGIQTLRDAEKQLRDRHRAEAHSYVLGYVNNLRDFARKNWMAPAETEERVLRLERTHLPDLTLGLESRETLAAAGV